MAVVEDRAVTPGMFAKFIFGAAGAAALAHALIAVSVTAGIDALYARRMYDIRKWPGPPTEALQLAGTYLRERVARSEPPVTLFAGSSVTHGYPWTQAQTFSTLYAAARGTSTINAGILALDVSGVDAWIICTAKANRAHVATLIVEIPVVNTVAQLANYHRAGTPVPPMPDCATPLPSPTYASWAWSRPLGLGWLVFLWEAEAYTKRDTIIRIEPVPAGYFTAMPQFNSVRRMYESQIARLLTNASTIAERVYAFPSPVYTAGLEQIGEDAASVRAQISGAVAACHHVGIVQCLDPSFLGERQEHFINFTHLNQAGHRAMAAWLASHVR